MSPPPHNECEDVIGEGHMVQSSEHTQEYEISFKESYAVRLPPSSDEMIGDCELLIHCSTLTTLQAVKPERKIEPQLF